MRKVLVLAFCLVLGMAVFAGGSTEEGGSTQPVVINYYDWDVPNQSFIDDFNREHPHIKVIVNEIPANAERTTKLDILAMSGGDMDVMPIADGAQFIRFEQGMLSSLDEFIERDGLDMESSFGKYAEWGKGSDGHYYGIPFRATQSMVWYNKAMFDEAGVPYPSDDWTYDEYIETARKMAQWGRSKGIYGTYTHTYSNEWATIAGQVGQWYTPDGACNIRDDAWVRALEIRKMLDNEGTQMSYGQIKAVKAVINSSFLGGKNAMTVAGSWLCRDMKNKEKFPFDFEVGIAYMPRYDESVEGNRSNFSASILGIPAKSEHKEEAWEFIKYYVQNASKAIAASGNMPTYLPAYTSEVVDIYREGSGLEYDYAAKFFNPDVRLTTNKILGPDGAKYMQIIDNNVQLYFTDEISLDKTLTQIEEQFKKEL
jgi:multiple sugar transport system substrate-binding protein